MTGRVEFSVSDGIASIVLTRPDKHNAITPDMAHELGRVCREVDASDGVRVAVISGAGDKAFSAGSDLNLLADLSDIWAFRNRLEYAAVVRDIRKPVIAALKGWVLGGGMEIALAADVRVAGRSTRIGGPRLVGYGQAMRMLLLGEPVDAEAALRMGLVEEVVDDNQALPRAHEMAAKIASFSPIATQAVKASVRAAMSMPLEAGLRYENEIHVICMSAKDRLEGIKAFQEGRKATFSGN